MSLILLAACLGAPTAGLPFPPTFALVLDLFDARRDLADFAAAKDGDYSRLYDLSAFERANGRDLSAVELSDIQRRWTAERDRVTARIRAIESDPVEAFVFGAEWRLSKLGVFDRAGLERVDGTGPIVYFAEPPMRGKVEQTAALRADLDPWMARMEILFQDLYAAPLRLERVNSRGATGICLLQSSAQYREFSKLDERRTNLDSKATYDRGLDVVVGYLGRNGLPELLEKRRTQLLQAQVTATLYAHKASEGDLESWIVQGLPAYLAHHEGKTPKALDVRTFDREWVGWICNLLQPEARRVLLPGLADLTQLSGPGAYDRWVEPRYREKTGKGLKDHWGANPHRAHAAALMYFLHRGADGRYAEGFRSYLRLALLGSGGPEQLQRCLGVADLKQIDDEFVDFAAKIYAVRYPDHPINRLKPIFPEDQAKGAGKPTAAAKKKAPKDRVRSTRSAKRPAKKPKKSARSLVLAVPAPTPATVVGIAAMEVATGAASAAPEPLRAWLADYGETEGADRVRQELERLERFCAMRHGVIGRLVADGKKLSVVLPAGKMIASVESVEGETMLLGRNRLKLKTLAFDDIPSKEWSRLMMDRRKVGLDPEPAMLLGLAVHGEEALEEAPKRFEIPKEWRRAAVVEYPRARREAELQAALELLGGAPGTGSVDDLIGAVNALLTPGPLASEEMTSQVKRLAKDVRRAGLGRLTAQYRQRTLDQLLAAKVTEHADGLVSISWDFESEDQIRDFRPDDPLLLTKLLDGVSELDQDDPFHIEGGQLIGTGAATLVSLVQIEAVEANWSVELGEWIARESFYFDLVLNLTKSGDYVAASSLRYLTTLRGMDWGVEEGQGPRSVGLNGPMTLSKTEEGWNLTHKGKVVVSNDRATPKSGRIALTNASRRGRGIEELVVSGYIQDSSRKDLAEEMARRDATEWGWVK